MTESNSTRKWFKLLSINTVLITVCALTLCVIFVYYTHRADIKLLDSLVREKLLKIDYDNNYLTDTALILEEVYEEHNIRINILESHNADIERRLRILEKFVKE